MTAERRSEEALSLTVEQVFSRGLGILQRQGGPQDTQPGPESPLREARFQCQPTAKLLGHHRSPRLCQGRGD